MRRMHVAGASQGTVALDVSSAAPFTGFQLQGTDTAPGAILHGPNGEVVTPTAGLYEDPSHRIPVITSAEERSTYIAIDQSLAGRWTATPADGAGGVAQVLSGASLPTPRMSAQVNGSGYTRTLRYRTAAGSGDRVVFFQSGTQIQRMIGEVRPGSGSIRFPVIDGPRGPRRIVAQVNSGGLTRASLTVARFIAPGPPPIGAVRVSAARRGSRLAISWRAAANADEYTLGVYLSDGRPIFQQLPAHARTFSVTAVGPYTSAVIKVAGTDRIHSRGPVALTRLAAASAPRVSSLTVSPATIDAGALGTGAACPKAPNAPRCRTVSCGCPFPLA